MQVAKFTIMKHKFSILFDSSTVSVQNQDTPFMEDAYWHLPRFETFNFNVYYSVTGR